MLMKSRAETYNKHFELRIVRIKVFGTFLWRTVGAVRRTFQLQLALELPVDLLLVELGVGALKVKVFLKLHGSVSAYIEAPSAAVSAPSAAPVSRCARSCWETE